MLGVLERVAGVAAAAPHPGALLAGELLLALAGVALAAAALTATPQPRSRRR